MKSVIALLALVGSAAAFAPLPLATRASTKLFNYGQYDDKLWDNEAKKVVYGVWDPNSPRSPMNFNPFETCKSDFGIPILSNLIFVSILCE